MISKRGLLIGAAVVSAGAIGAGVWMTNADAAVETGGPAPNFSVRDVTGATRTLAEFRGRTVVLEWTNHGCPYVRKHYNSNNMQTLQQEATANGVVWLQVLSTNPNSPDYQDAPTARAWVQASNAHPTATLLDENGAVGHAYGARNTPHMFIVNGEGRVVYQGAIDDHASANPRSIDGAHNYVRAALADIAAGRAVARAETTPYGCSVKYSG